MLLMEDLIYLRKLELNFYEIASLILVVQSYFLRHKFSRGHEKK